MKITIDEPAWTTLCQDESNALRSFVKADDTVPPQYLFVVKGRSEVIGAVISDNGTKIEIYPERSASQKVLRKALGA